MDIKEVQRLLDRYLAFASTPKGIACLVLIPIFVSAIIFLLIVLGDLPGSSDYVSFTFLMLLLISPIKLLSLIKSIGAIPAVLIIGLVLFVCICANLVGLHVLIKIFSSRRARFVKTIGIYAATLPIALLFLIINEEF